MDATPTPVAVTVPVAETMTIAGSLGSNCTVVSITFPNASNTVAVRALVSPRELSVNSDGISVRLTGLPSTGLVESPQAYASRDAAPNNVVMRRGSFSLVTTPCDRRTRDSPTRGGLTLNP